MTQEAATYLKEIVSPSSIHFVILKDGRQLTYLDSKESTMEKEIGIENIAFSASLEEINQMASTLTNVLNGAVDVKGDDIYISQVA